MVHDGGRKKSSKVWKSGWPVMPQRWGNFYAISCCLELKVQKYAVELKGQYFWQPETGIITKILMLFTANTCCKLP